MSDVEMEPRKKKSKVILAYMYPNDSSLIESKAKKGKKPKVLSKVAHMMCLENRNTNIAL